MAKSNTPAPLKVPGVAVVPQGYPVVLHIRGSEAYESLRVNGPVQLEREDGTVLDGSVQALQIGPLIDLVGMVNMSATAPIGLFGRSFSPLALIQSLTQASGEDVLDVTKLYTAVTVFVPSTPIVTVG